MRGLRGWFGVIVALVVLAVAGVARATVMGDIDPSNTDPGFGGLCVGADADYAQAGIAPGDPSYTVPTGGGTITNWSTRYGVDGAAMALEVWRPDPTTEARYVLVGLDAETIARDSAGVSTFSTSLPVEAGDVLGLQQATAGSIHCAFHANNDINRFTLRYFGAVLLGSATQFVESGAVFNDLLNISATIHQSADLAVSQTATPSTVHTGQVVQLLFKASDAGPAPSTATISDKLPAGLTAISAVAQDGACSLGPVVTCRLSLLAPASSDSIVVNARATKTGRQTSTATVSGESTNTDPKSSNNTASARLTVQPNRICRVPNLIGHSLTRAKKLLDQADCALGKVTKPSHHKRTLVVVSQHPSAGERKPSGTRVAVKLGRKTSH
jgi:Domain of unknown function DUF11/PASTA domain